VSSSNEVSSSSETPSVKKEKKGPSKGLKLGKKKHEEEEF
jgi:hypothetical protein